MIHFTDHALDRLVERGIDITEARRAVYKGRPVADRNEPGRYRIHFDRLVVVLAVVPDATEAAVITAWRTP